MMSSSPSRSPLATPARTDVPTPVREISPFPYPESPPGAGPAGDRGEKSPSINHGTQPATDAAERETKARALGREEGRAEGRKNFEEQLAKERTTLAVALTQFAQDRTAYYQKVETEVVQLALSIARQILHREAQVDPLLLAGIVRVALEKIEGATAVKLRIHPHDAPDLRRHLASHLNPADMPEIIEDAAIEPDRCILETSMGIADLGKEVQMKEIERGMMDLLAARPGVTS
jgi:flagellar assembly protein FliH